MSEILKQAYSAELFRAQGHQLIDQLADYLETVRRPDYPRGAIDYYPPEAALEQWGQDLKTTPNPDVQDLFTRAMGQSVRLLHPQYVGHQISPPVPVAALAGLLGDFLNNGMGVYEMGMAGTTTERLVAQLVARQLGFPEESDGFITSGGTLANLTALLCARGRNARANIWKEGQQGQLALMVSEEAHYCVDRAVRIMGWGDAGVIKIPVDDRFRMRTDLLEKYFDEAVAEGKEVIAVVGSACTTATGSFDDLNAIGDFCNLRNLWFHVDGAHGAALAFSQKFAPVVKGIEKADSVAMDFHKMLLTPSITTALVFRRGSDSFRTFTQQAEYLFNKEEPEWFNMAKRTFECTKLMIGFKVYSIFRTYGAELFDEYVTLVCELGRMLAEMVRARQDLTLAIEPFCNIVCFRYEPAGLGEEQVNDLNERIRQALLEEGAFYVVQTRLKGALYLRCTLTNPFTEAQHLSKLLDRIVAVAEQELASHQ